MDLSAQLQHSRKRYHRDYRDPDFPRDGDSAKKIQVQRVDQDVVDQINESQRKEREREREIVISIAWTVALART